MPQNDAGGSSVSIGVWPNVWIFPRERVVQGGEERTAVEEIGLLELVGPYPVGASCPVGEASSRAEPSSLVGPYQVASFQAVEERLRIHLGWLEYEMYNINYS